MSPAVSGAGAFKTKNMLPLARGLPIVTTSLGAMGLRRYSLCLWCVAGSFLGHVLREGLGVGVESLGLRMLGVGLRVEGSRLGCTDLGVLSASGARERGEEA